MLERGGNVKTMIVPDRYQTTLQVQIKEHVEPGATIYTDAFAGYQGLEASYTHKVIDHKKTFVEGDTHTNSIEGFWNLFKRSYKGTYTHLSRQHLSRYLTEQTFRYNTRKASDGQRFQDWFRGCERRLTHKQLTS
jgi:transposase-like protein